MENYRLEEHCAQCLLGKQYAKTENTEYRARIKKLLDERKPSDTSPFLIFQFDQIYEEMFGKKESGYYAELKKQFNDFVLNLEADIQKKIEADEDPLAAALRYARVGNYIDFGALKDVSVEEFSSLLEKEPLSERDLETYASFIEQCGKAKSFLLLCDNCGEIVLDKLFLMQLKKRFPQMELNVMVRGGEIFNDATREDAVYVGIDQIASLYDNGHAVCGTVDSLLSDDAHDILHSADVILAKGQGNYESLHGEGIHVFFAFLCKCDLFVSRFNVPQFTGIFIEEEQ